MMKENETGWMKEKEPVVGPGEVTVEGDMQPTDPEGIGNETADVIRDNRGVGVVEVILILVVLIALVLIFKDQLGSMVTKAMDALEKSMNEVLS